MKVLSFETSTPRGSVALVSEQTVYGEEFLLSSRSHCERLIPTVDLLLNRCQTSLSHIDFFATAVGPGSFTGIRIGLATVKAFAFAQHKKVVGVSTLEAMSFGVDQMVPGTPGARHLCCIVDAGRGEVYARLSKKVIQAFAGIPNSQLCLFERLISPQRLVQELRTVKNEQNIEHKILLLGDDVSLDHEIFRQSSDLIEIVSPDLCYPRASAVGLLALQKSHQNLLQDPQTLLPSYIRMPEAVAKLIPKINN